MAKKASKSKKAVSKKTGCCAEVPVDNVFYLNDGRILKSLCELRDALKAMDAGTFSHHVNQERNDFANWVRDIMKKKAVANQMAAANTRKAMLAVVSKACK